ncbi:MAG: hypothetical protein KDM91_05490 [Verrucomicrobiae bacterium]|nr:hypothetical protein [Verrucomicrobiae bacterium]
MRRPERIFLACFLFGWAATGPLRAADPSPAQAPTAPPRVWRGSLANPLADPVTLIHRSNFSPDQSPPATLEGLVLIADPASDLRFAWDPMECRLLLVWRGGEAPTRETLVYAAEGPPPTAAAIGAWGAPEYFGYRLAEGAVEFLYIQGRLAVVERVMPGEGGKSFVQRLTIENADLDVMLSLPERWREKIRASVGKWSGESLLKLKPEEAKAGVELTFDLAKAPEPPELNANWLKPGPPAPAAKTEDRQP